MPTAATLAADSIRTVPPPRPAVAAPIVFLPTLTVDDPLARYWLRQVTLRLRREICWLWHERGHGAAENSGRLPPPHDKLSTVLDLARYVEQKTVFFATDETARYLTSLLADPPPAPIAAPTQGSFAWVIDQLALDELSAFVLALGLAPVVDHAVGTVFAAVLHDHARTSPTLALAQRLWEQPDELLTFTDPAHPLWRSGLLAHAASAESSALEWDAPLNVPALLVPTLLFPSTALPAALHALSTTPDPVTAGLPTGADLALARLRAPSSAVPRLQPLIGPPGTAFADIAANLARAAGRALLESAGTSTPLPMLCTLAWLRGTDLFAELEPPRDGHDEKFLPTPSLPLTLFLGVRDRAALRRLPTCGLLPALTVPALTYVERRELWHRMLAPALTPELAPAVDECARRFRCERTAVLAAGRSLLALDRPLTPDDLFAACRAEFNLDIGDLAQAIEPRFEEQDLVLPPKQARQIREIVVAMQALTEVHYGWGAARAWNECGLSALFAGPSGTGKTMAAEVISARLGLPLYRIDLSQVVNKYIGETEKNLRRLFDAADASDVVLFFDEADALFGKRTEVKDAHDRYANLEVSYLLERMERFKGLAILATNRKKDLDEAFLRRLRYVVDFPVPGYDERLRIWRQLLPNGVDCSQLDLPFIAQKLPLAGGHLRSIVFNACLQSARRGPAPAITMPAILAAAKREYEKLERPLNRDQLGTYVAAVECLDAPS
jgi:ATPase family associated with various cellular activities (AAA)